MKGRRKSVQFGRCAQTCLRTSGIVWDYRIPLCSSNSVSDTGANQFPFL